VQAERKRFDESPQINDPTGDEPSELNVLKAKYRQMLSDQRLLHSRKLVTLCKKYVNDLTDMQKTFMQDGKMDLASAVNAEIRRVKGSPQQQAAEAPWELRAWSVLPAGVPKLAVEAGATAGWWKYTGLDGDVIGLDRFGASAPGPKVMAELGFSAENVAARAKVLVVKQ